MTVVTFNVSVPVCHDGVSVFVTGDCSELGKWSPHAAEPLTLVSSTDCTEVWSTTVEISAECFEYRYFTACILQSSSSAQPDYCGCVVAVQSWESGKKPRAMDLTTTSGSHDQDVYGVYNGIRSISRGWLTGQSEICMRMHGQTLWLKDDTASQATYSIICEPVDLQHDDSSSTLCTKHCRFGPVCVGKLTDDVLSYQSDDGISFGGCNDHVMFKVQTCALDNIVFKFYIHSDQSDGESTKMNEIGIASHYVGTSNKADIVNLPVFSSQRQIVGALRLDFVVIHSITDQPEHLDFSPQKWDKPQHSLNIGHRGLGSSYINGVPSARVPENTVLSFSEAAKCGADMVEFDVMLTSDNVPVVFHDFKASANLMSTDNQKLHSLLVPVSELSVEQLNTGDIRMWRDSVAGNTRKTEEERPFPTLRHCLEVIDPSLGFDIEVKYCMRLRSTGQYEEEMQHFAERNGYVDSILDVIFRHANDRQILLSCFDPDVCSMMRMKQTRYPVAFISQGETLKYETFQDPRAASLEMAVNFANIECLTGVALHTEDLLKDVRLIDLAHSLGLSVFCWGEENNNVDTIKLLRKHRLDGIIYDRVDEFMWALSATQGQ